MDFAPGPRAADLIERDKHQHHTTVLVPDDSPLDAAWSTARAVRLTDGPDEVHLDVAGRLESAEYSGER
ncbi:hypothetical protein [Nocardia sp. NPDC059239]|uniref:hypothetical protein n=1 Tax=unclassified Nocardia TaxID=2637762 RepID=UPI0036CDC498